MPAQKFYLVGRDSNAARDFDVDPADKELKALRITLSKEFHIIETKGKFIPLSNQQPSASPN